jgi:hypothetical protein
MHVHASVVVCSVNSRCCRLPIENGIAVCATGYWRLAASRETVLRQRQRSSTDEQRDDRKSFHAGHFHLQVEPCSPWRERERVYGVVRSE